MSTQGESTPVPSGPAAAAAGERTTPQHAADHTADPPRADTADALRAETADAFGKVAAAITDARTDILKPGPATDMTSPDTAPPDAAPPDAEDAPPRRFGARGKPLDRYSPFFVGFTGALGVLAAWAVYKAVLGVWSILLLIMVAGFLAIGLNPAVTRLQAWGLRRGFAVAAVGLAAVGVVVGMVFALAPPIVEQGGDLSTALPGYIDDLKRNRFLNDMNERFDLLDKIKAASTGENASKAVGGVLGGVGLVLGTLFNIVTGLILMFYFLAAFERLKSGAYRLVPASRRERTELLGNEMLARVGNYLSGAVIIAAIAGVSSFTFMWITGVPYPFALALVVAILDLIPQVGATLGAVVAAIVAFFVSVPVGIAALIFFIAYQQLENWIIYPRVMKKSVNVSDLAAIVSVLLGASLLGIVGALLAIPICAAVQLIVREVVFPRQDAA
jgi:predicted PurR-regulated permease PerM